jgi:hypothetical protein
MGLFRVPFTPACCLPLQCLRVGRAWLTVWTPRYSTGNTLTLVRQRRAGAVRSYGLADGGRRAGAVASSIA